MNPPKINALVDQVTSSARQRQEDLNDQIAAVKSRLQETLSQICKKEIPVPIYTIQGTLLVSREGSPIKRSKQNEHVDKEDPKYKDTDITEDANHIVVEDQPVLLCSAEAGAAVQSMLFQYADQYNLKMDDFGRTWHKYSESGENNQV